MAESREEYILDTDGLNPTERSAAWRAALTEVRDGVDAAETDIPWSKRDGWPEDVHVAAARLVARYVPGDQWRDYMQTSVQSFGEDRLARDDFLTFAAYAFDATLWGDGDRLASLADEGQSFVVWLTEQQRTALVERVGTERLVPVAVSRKRGQRDRE